MSADEQLSARLEAVLGLVPPCRHLVDVGCDHAWVPLAAVRRGLAGRATGVDRALAPLAQAQGNLDACGETRVELLRADGLRGWADETVQVVVLAGLGARSIIRVIETAPVWLQRGAVWVLQPNTQWAGLRQWARRHGLHLQAERMVLEDGRYFWTCRYQMAPGPDPVYTASFAARMPPASWQGALALEVLGPWLFREPDPIYLRWLTHEARRQRRILTRGGDSATALRAIFEGALVELGRQGDPAVDAGSFALDGPDDRGGF